MHMVATMTKHKDSKHYSIRIACHDGQLSFDSELELPREKNYLELQ